MISSAATGKVCNQDLASEYQLSHWCNLFGHLERSMVITVHVLLFYIVVNKLRN